MSELLFQISNASNFVSPFNDSPVPLLREIGSEVQRQNLRLIHFTFGVIGPLQVPKSFLVIKNN